MRKVDAFLSRKAQAVWPTAIVWKEEASSAAIRLNEGGNGCQIFILQREGHADVALGNYFGKAKASLEALLAGELSKRDAKKPIRDEFLSRKASELWPTAIVWDEEPSSEMLRLNGNGNRTGQVFILKRECHGDIILGHNFGEAKAGLDALLASERSKRAAKEQDAV